MANPVRIGVSGALGRMGRAVAAVVRAEPGASLGPLADRPDRAGEAIEGAKLASFDELLAGSDVIVDFSTPAASLALARAAAQRGGPALVVGTTGLSPEEVSWLDEASERTAIVRSGNYSLGLNVLLGLVEQAARALQARDWDIEVSESHHRRKVDAPSGTALMLGEAAARGREVSLAQVAIRARDGVTGPRPEGGIGFSVVRGGGIIGEHAVSFAAEEEIITLAHSARDRGLFARGAVAAALWAAGRPPGLYDMMDVLGFREAR
ncbi:4-hydroxy-tetrahydrodipicolinate reductase [Phenylobacterium montanum]|uniref:4-hydroxy-tetrahydrodipicolinate reductase n=1 Tax=Phenylobacterium montanum TaxID=2823693 RepID=A0A975IT06_9CAUL|nr:4-hydroxy-tetrahydrodipicolinate reductase [Caulobacter sp. S6]QUD86283.1 4-hydroxy-tetrahydrodipicolinate reductase [Caulobacter sp. S6]